MGKHHFKEMCMVFSLFGKKKTAQEEQNRQSQTPSLPLEPDPAPSSEAFSPEQTRQQPEEVSPTENGLEGPSGARASRGLFLRLRQGLSKTREILTTDVDDLLLGRKLDENLLETLEENLITADLGVESSLAIVDRIRSIRGRVQSAGDLKRILKEEILREMAWEADSESPEPHVHTSPHVLLVVGVNGVGKTTTIGKLAALHVREGKKVILAAGDTFRAAAGEQLALWAERSGASLIRHKDNSDPASVAYDALDAAIARKADLVIVDTAGRLHNKVNLMEELKKIRRTLEKRMPGAPHETLLVLDATTGQNALRQAEIFHEAVGLTGLVLTKLDGTAKGGIVIAVQKHLGLPIRFIGVGEGVEDLQPFDAQAFLDAMF
jgi:fused signal recognition particle receptor